MLTRILSIDYLDDDTIREQIAGKAIIYLEHIHAGYRVDVMDIDADPVAVIRGLCRRDVFYLTINGIRKAKRIQTTAYASVTRMRVGWWTPCRLPIQEIYILMKNCSLERLEPGGVKDIQDGQ